jgi:hypothetical protein
MSWRVRPRLKPFLISLVPEKEFFFFNLTKKKKRIIKFNIRVDPQERELEEERGDALGRLLQPIDLVVVFTGEFFGKAR